MHLNAAVLQSGRLEVRRNNTTNLAIAMHGNLNAYSSG